MHARLVEKGFLELIVLNFYHLHDATSILLAEFNDCTYEAVRFFFLIDSVFFQLSASNFFTVPKMEDVFAYFVYICLLLA